MPEMWFNHQILGSLELLKKCEINFFFFLKSDYQSTSSN